MEPNAQIDMAPKRRRLWIIGFAVVVLGLMVVAVVEGMNTHFSSPPFAIQFATSPTNRLVPQFDITNVSDFAVYLQVHLECQTNGSWTNWPPVAPNEEMAWYTSLTKHVAKTGWSFSGAPTNDTSAPFRLCGLVGKEKVGLARLVNSLRRCWYYRGQTNIPWKVIWNGGCRPYHTPVSFCSSPFYLTNATTPLTITMGEEVAARR